MSKMVARLIAFGVIGIVLLCAAIAGWWVWQRETQQVTQAVYDLANDAYHAEQKRMVKSVQETAVDARSQWEQLNDENLQRIQNEVDLMSDRDYWTDLERRAGACGQSPENNPDVNP